MSKNEKKPFYKKWWFWVIVVIALVAVGGGMSTTTNQANQQTSSSSESQATKEETKPRLTLDDGWEMDKSNQLMTQVVGTVSNNSDKAIDNYIQITFTALDKDGANVGDCLANTNTVDANGKWKFKAMCSGENEDIETIRFKEITGF